MKHLESVIESGIFDKIDKSEYIKAFEQLLVSEKKLKKDQVLFYEGETIDRICIIERGSVRSEKTYVNGEVHIMQVYEKGGMFGLESAVSKSKSAPIDYISNENSTIVFVPLKAIEKSDYYGMIMGSLTQRLANDNIKKMHKIEILVQKGLRDRIMLYLEILRKKSGSNIVYINMNREKLASYLCVNRSALSNELNKMKREGIIDFKKNQFEILNK